MKYFIIILLLASVNQISLSQEIANGGFEDVVINSGNPDLSYPEGWLPFHAVFLSVECFPNVLQGVLTSDSRTGQYALKMETFACTEVGGGLVHRSSGYTNGNFGTTGVYTIAIDHDQSVPETLTFHYKYEQEGDDTAYAKVLLFNYDDVTPDLNTWERVDTVGFAIGYITDASNEYQLYSLPIEYVSSDQPSYVKVEFGSGSDCTLETCTPGTTLWVDDVSFDNTFNLIEYENNAGFDVEVYPNPAVNNLNLVVSNIRSSDVIVEILDYQGKILLKKGVNKIDQKESTISLDTSTLGKGVYFMKTTSSHGCISKIFVKE